MKKFIFTVVFSVFALSGFAQVEKILGEWCTIDDQINEPVSIVKIFKGSNGKYYGKIVRITYPGFENAVCEKCKGELHGKPMQGMTIIYDMVYDAEHQRLGGGKVLDPNNGKFYYGHIWFDAKKNKLILRGSLDSRGILGRSQEWQRLPK